MKLWEMVAFLVWASCRLSKIEKISAICAEPPALTIHTHTHTPSGHLELTGSAQS